MFVREKCINGYTYLYLVETVREDGRAKQRIIKNLGRKEVLAASGALERLASSVARYAERAVVLSQIEAGNPERLACKRIGTPLLFGRLWEETSCGAVIEDLLAGRGFEFPLERAIFATVLHRIMVSGSDRACEKWLADYDIPDVDGLALHYLYRAMAWLGEELDADQQDDATPFAPRTIKDLIEERLFARRRDLFSELSVVFLDTTSLSFTGAGGATLGERGYSKDHRPDLMQMIVGVVIAALEERGLEYVLGARERTDSLIRTVVLADQRPFTPLCIPRAGGEETQLFVKEVQAEGRHYIVCRNEAEAAKEAADRQAIVATLDQPLKRGDKALIGNSAYRRYLRPTSNARAFEIDPGKLADEARYDGLFVLRTNARITPLQAVLRYRDLIQVEQLFRTAKALMRTRPIYHCSDAAIRGHVFCSFLALILRKELDERCRMAGFRPEWGDVLRDLDRLQEVMITKDGREMTLRTPATGTIGPLFKAARIALPPNVRDASAA